ncbi:uncharacterized protein LOC128405937 [Podarcis raffonei]|uniref:uncharacterized protein LOC128405937 n=1 Tax=Podarcis raffonei TaxID=65483 RepID=UPI0023297638|nr:uncharacterized protein LOC128405937 [Podarcis raffonei]
MKKGNLLNCKCQQIRKLLSGVYGKGGQKGKQIPLGFWSRKLPTASYTPFEKQLLACYWALVDTECLTGQDPVMLRPAIPIMAWVQDESVSPRVGRAQQSSIVKWKWYIADRARVGPQGVSALQEQVLALTPTGEEVQENSVVKLDKVHFTDGSAGYQGNERVWCAAAINPKTIPSDGGAPIKIKQLTPTHTLKGWGKVFEQAEFEQSSSVCWTLQRMSSQGIFLPVTHLKVWKVQPYGKLPLRAMPDSAGADLITPEEVVVPAGGQVTVSLGIGIAVPPGTYGRIAPWLELALKGIQILGGVVDTGYQDEIKVLLHNIGVQDVILPTGQRIAQLICEK